MVSSAVKTEPFRRKPGFAVEASVERSKLGALVAWFFAPPKLPNYPPIDYSQEPAAARAARLRRIQGQVDDLMTPLSAADIAGRYYPYW